MSKPTEKYSVSQILFGLHDVFLDMTQSDEIFTLRTPVIQYLRSDGSWDEADLADLFSRIEEYFAFRCTRDQWLELFGKSIATRSRWEWEREFVPEFTFGGLAAFIAERAPVRASCAPVSIASAVMANVSGASASGLLDMRDFGRSNRISNVLNRWETSALWW